METVKGSTFGDAIATLDEVSLGLELGENTTLSGIPTNPQLSSLSVSA